MKISIRKSKNTVNHEPLTLKMELTVSQLVTIISALEKHGNEESNLIAFNIKQETKTPSGKSILDQ